MFFRRHMNLEGIKDYIHQNNHLADVSSGKSMENDGIALCEMNMLLLRKVEELTLYLLEKDKEMK